MSFNGENETLTVSEKTRIYIGGLGVSVTEEDLKNTFGSLGEIEKVDIIKTKERSFAYLDFLPSNHKSLSKLFSMYNGCMWKGGRLKLEKAKEHYLLRLEKERSEDAELANGTIIDDVDATESMDITENMNKIMNPKAAEIRMFFPKLRKLRPLPLKGTGKHKYSFQRIEVPALPTHFCSCEEHFKPVYSARENKLFVRETHDGGIDERELNIMESVMNKLFGREDKPRAETGLSGLVSKIAPKRPANALAVDGKLQENIIEEDDDNLVMNMVAMGNAGNGPVKSWRQETNWDEERTLVNGLRIANDEPFENKLMGQRIEFIPPEKRKSPITEPADREVPCISVKGKKSFKRGRPNDSERKGLGGDTTGDEGTVMDPIQISELSNSALRNHIRRLAAKKKKVSNTETILAKVASTGTEGKKIPGGDRLHGLYQGPSTKSIKPNIDGSLLKQKDTGVGKCMMGSSLTTKEESNTNDNENQNNKNLLEDLRDFKSRSDSSKKLKEVAIPLKKTQTCMDKQPKKGGLWANLVRGTDTSFSISQLLPEMTPGKQEQPKN